MNHHNRLKVWMLIAIMASIGCDSEAKKNITPVQKEIIWAVKEDPNLPRVLLIGDSISIGYTLHVREMLQGKANVHRPFISPTKVWNCGPTTRGLESLDKWLGDKPWDVIHFNFGLHDLKYVDENGKMVDSARGRQLVPVDQYRENLEAIIKKLQKTQAQLIFATTTPVPAGTSGRVAGDEAKYNQAALEVMKKHHIAVDDLCAHAVKKLDKIQRPRNVHFTDQGYQYLAEQVTKTILQALEKKTSSGNPPEK